jgi:8-hydroxy-5-deazaflavin:NADPH oxidoreductase
MKRIGILGSGMVGQALATGFLKHGYEVKVGTGDPKKLSQWLAKAGAGASIGSFAETAAFGEIVVLAVKGAAAIEAVKKAGPAALAGKTVIDTTNPIADVPPVNGVLKFFTTLEESLMEKLQAAYPPVNFVKAFSSVGNAAMVDPKFPGGKPTMFICGNIDSAKAEVRDILDQFGWETEDMGKVEAARAIEPLCMLWCIPGFQRNQWSHAFKLLKMG